MNPALLRNLNLVAAMVLGALCPAAHQLQFLIRYLVMAMLWMAFLNIQVAGFRREHGFVLAANWLIGLGAWAIFAGFNRDLALAALLIGMTPTATAAPVITGMLGGRVEFVTGSVVLTNVVAGLFFPLLLPPILGTHTPIPVLPFLYQTAGIVLVPLFLAQALRLGAPKLTKTILSHRQVSFYAWLLVLFLATANASHFMRTTVCGFGIAAQIALIAAGLCAVNFSVGRKIGGSTLAREASQSLGQKNTMLTIWLALTFVNPLVALGPTFYIVCHNSYNAWQLARSKHPL